MTTANDPAATIPDAALRAELEAVLDGLFRGPRERFVPERNAAALRLRTRGRAEAAAVVKGLPKPSLSAWAVNQLWWTARAEVEALLDASRHLAELMGGSGPAAQAAAGQARRRALEALVTAASDTLAQAGHATGAGTLRRISATLEAVAAHAALGSRDVPSIGRLTEDLDPPGFELVMGLGAGLGPLGASTPTLPSPAPVPAAGPGQGEVAAAVAAAERERDAAKLRVGEAARALDEARRVADEAVLAAQRSAEAHREARERAEAARQLADEAERVALRAQAEARREQERVDVAREALDGRAAELDRRTEALVRARHRLAVLGPGRG